MFSRFILVPMCLFLSSVCLADGGSIANIGLNNKDGQIVSATVYSFVVPGSVDLEEFSMNGTGHLEMDLNGYKIYLTTPTSKVLLGQASIPASDLQSVVQLKNYPVTPVSDLRWSVVQANTSTSTSCDATAWGLKQLIETTTVTYAVTVSSQGQSAQIQELTSSQKTIPPFICP